MKNILLFIYLFNIVESFRHSELYYHARNHLGCGYYEVSRCEGGWILDYYDDNEDVEHMCIINECYDNDIRDGLVYVCDIMNKVIDGDFV